MITLGHVAKKKRNLFGIMPSGASGIWYAKDYNSAKKAVPNSLTGVAPLDAYTRYGVQEIPLNEDGGLQEWGSVGSSTVSVTGPTGSTINATRFVAAGDFYSGLYDNAVPAGTYTLAFDVKSNTGVSQNFQCGNFNGGMLQKVATTSWQRMTASLTSASAIWPMLCMSFDRSTGADLLFANVSIFNGSADLGRLSGANMFLGRTGATNPSIGVLDFSAGGGAIVQLDAPIANIVASGFTGGAMFKRATNGSFNYQSIFSRLEGFNSLTAFIENGQNSFTSALGGATVGGAGAWDTYGQGWHVLTYRWDGTYFDLFLDASRVLHRAISPAAVSLRNILFGALKSISGFTGSHQFNSWFFYPTALTTVQIQTGIYPALKARLLADGQSHTQARVICAEGDSITAGGGYFSLSAANINGQGFSYAVPGSGIVDMVTRLTTQGVQTVPITGSMHIISVLIGANDLGSYAGANTASGAANYTAALFAYFDTLRTAGWKVLACTVLPNGGVEHNARRAIVNANIRAAVGVRCDGVCDFDTDAQMGIDNSFTAFPANWTDSTHPNGAGHARLAPIYTAAINSIGNTISKTTPNVELTAASFPAGTFYKRDIGAASYGSRYAGLITDTAITDPSANGVVRVQNATLNIVAHGDSQIQGPEKPILHQLVALLNNQGVVANYKNAGWGGLGFNYTYPTSGWDTGAGLNTLAASDVDAARSGTLEDWLLVFAGTNDMFLGGSTGAATYGFFDAYMAARVAAGWAENRIIMVSCPPRQNNERAADFSAFNTALIGKAKTGGGTWGYNLIRLDQPINGVTLNAQGNTTYFSDTIHLTNAGAALVAAAAKGIIRP